MFRDSYTPAAFTLALARKDLELATELAREVGVLVADLVERLVLEGLARGGRARQPRGGATPGGSGGSTRPPPDIDLARAACFITTHPES